MTNLNGTLSKVSNTFYENGENVKITGGYYNTDPTYPKKPHTGYDYKALTPLGLVAPLDGEVLSSTVKDTGTGYGIYTHIYFPSVDHTLHFAHLSKCDLKVGQKLKKGELFAYTGKTGNVAPHLHLGAMKGKSTNINKLVNNVWAWVDVETLDLNNSDTEWISEPNYQITLNRDIEERNECIADSTKATGVELIKKGTVLRVNAWRYAQGFVWRKLDNGKVISTGPQGDGQAWAKLSPYKELEKPVEKPINDIKVGDMVKIKDNSFYQGAENGEKPVSKYGYSSAWKVLEVKGTVARLDNINSWLLISDLVKV